jgi:hypothetical protein
MKRSRSDHLLASCLAAILLTAATTILSGWAPAYAADNHATGDIAGTPGTLGTSNTFTINSTLLSLVKAAFLVDGTPVASGSTIPKGTLVKFMIYLDNTTAVPVDSLNVSDALDALFAYQSGTLKVDDSQNSGAAVAAIFAAANGAASLTDAVSNADVAGISGSTVSAGSGSGNALVTVPASKVWAMLFTVKIQ